MSLKGNKSSVSPARRAAFNILRRVEEERAYASALLASLPASDLSREDRALTHEIVLGVLRWRKALDYFIEKYARRPVRQLDLPVLLALRIGLYQLRFLTRVPHAPAVNESVNLVKKARAASAAGMVNAVLRNAARHPDEQPGDDIADARERLSVAVSHPRWLLERWIAWLGEEQARELALAQNQQPPTAFRVNTLRGRAEEILASLEKEGVAARPSEIAEGALVAEGGTAALMRAAESGLAYIQDEASQLVALLLDPRPGEAILDLCAAPGSKSSHLAALTRNGAWIIACDLHPHRLATLAAACRRMGADSVHAVALDATGELPFAEDAQKFDRVLIDAPCSGTGTLRRNPEIKWRLTPEDIARLADVQLRLLERGAAALANGGRLVYSTCSLEPEENEGVVKRFLDGGAPFRVLAPDARADLITADGFVRTYPHRHGADGFFAAALEKVKRDV
ncbi:MAG TPA: 16S rRNA (cytosine(967)-C(5))-methyltransferase RsmB [Blastocatellia bacterium]|nr:16S rRNA (cytosine(967)-C(5))-methyltransferase RsmB [Blastocatellia bacterium]